MTVPSDVEELEIRFLSALHALCEREILFAQIHRALRTPDLTCEERVQVCLEYIREVAEDIGREPSLDPPF